MKLLFAEVVDGCEGSLLFIGALSDSEDFLSPLERLSF